jgi:hypothetical protein
MENDLTVVYYTANYISDEFFENTWGALMLAIGDLPLITVSQKPMGHLGGRNICVGDIGRSHLNIYRQILIGAKAAGTRYVALAEDDILYPASHFQLRPSSDEVFNYDVNKWSLYTWTRPPIFSRLDNIVVHQLISNRDYLIDDLEERFRRWPDESKLDLGNWKDPGRRENRLGMEERRVERSWASDPTIAFSHQDAYGYLTRGTNKAHGRERTDYLAPWGSAEEVLKLYKGRNET